jgi:transcriptional regulator with GAF, ATPase, and Fis domain
VPRRFADFLARLRGDRDEDGDRARLLAVLGLNRELALASDRRQLLTALLDEAVRLFAAERGFVLAVAADGAGFTVAAARSLDKEPVQHPERKISTTIVRRALEQGQGTFSEDAQSGDLAASQSVADLQLRSVLCMPLVVGDRILGCIYLDHRFQKHAFTERDLSWLQAFADQGAIVLHLHELLQQNREQAAALAAQNRALAAQVAAQAEELADLRPELSRAGLRHDFPAIIGEAPALLRALQLLDRSVDAAFSVLLCGESGTGKELAALALHDAGPRRGRAFVGVNVAAVPKALLESELFGHVRGAFTGADRDRLGLVREADGGTLFLDEITEMDLEVQARLLRFLEEREVRPLGSDRTHPVDVRIVAATNRDPRAAISEGRLREDLYFRLAVVTIEMPPLRARRADLPLLVRHFLQAIATERNEPVRAPTPELLRELARRAWPGNLRQLQNELQRLCALAGPGQLGPALLSPEAPLRAAGPDTFDLATLERWAIDRALAAAGGNKAEAARLLGIARRTLYARLGDNGPGR